MRVAALALGALMTVAAPARADHDEYLGLLAAKVRARLVELAAARAPKAIPPVPVVVKWKATKLASLDLGAPLAALAAADLDGDHKDELYAVTARHVIAFGTRNGKLVELGRVLFSGERTAPASRDVVGTAVVEGKELVAAVSTYTNEVRISWQTVRGKPALVAQPGAPGFLVCAGERVQLAPGRNHFTTNAYAVRCRADLVDRAGHPLRVRGELAMTGKLAVALEGCARGTCQMLGGHEYGSVGAAFELADVDRDGTPDVIASDASAPGDPDAVKVYSLGGDPKKPLFKKKFNGGVAALAAVDGDGDGVVEVVAAVRLAGATRVDLWRLN